MSAHTARALAAWLAVAWLAAAAASAADAKSFASPEQAVEELVAAVRAGDRPAVLAVLGTTSSSILDSGDAVADQRASERFVADYEAAHEIVRPSAERAELVTGADEWPFPIPIVKQGASWRFDVAAGEQEILARRIGRNERFTIQACLAFVDAQREYWERNPDGAPLLHYARRFISSEGKRDGLYYPTGDDEEPSPIGPGFARARAAGYEYAKGNKIDSPHPFLGYHYRMLERQGRHASDGAYAYVAKDWMIGGFALVAYPATYDNSGVMTFVVNQSGDVFQKDLGAETAKRAPAIESFDPDDTWTRVPSEDLALGAEPAAAH